MPNLNDAGKRDFVNQIISLLDQNAATLTGEGYDPANKSTSLKTKSQIAQEAEVNQQEALIKARTATQLAQESLIEAYKEASATVELLAGILGKDHPLLHEIRKMRK